MPFAGTSRSEVLAEREPAFQRIRARTREMGLNFSVWDPQGQSFGTSSPACELCRLLQEAGAPCAQGIRDLVAHVHAEKRSAWRNLSCGCVVMAMPIRQRRRLVGTAVVDYPSTEWLDEELLARRCDAFQLDRQVVAEAAREGCRHSADQAGDMLRTFEWLLDDEQSLHTANEELRTLSVNLTTTYEELSLIYRISGSVRVTQRPQEFLLSVCEQLREVMGVAAAVALVHAHPPATQEDLVVLAGDVELSADQVKLLAVTQIAPLLAENPRAVVDNQFSWRTRPDLGGKIWNLIAVPLLGEQSLGLLLALNKAGDFNSIDIKLMSSVGNQSAVFLTNNMLYADLQDLLMGVLHALTATIDAKDPYTCGHSNRVAMISRRLAEECGLPPARVQQIYLAGLLHDIGKIGVPESTLCKPGRLTPEEYEDVKRHPGIGAKILGGIRQLEDVLGGILYHHERLDGKGYPHGLREDEVPLDARIIGLADCFDAMSSDRTYRKALPLPTVIEEIRTHAGTQFDPDVAQQLLSLDLRAFLEELRQPAETVFPVRITQEAAP
jgi:HD-GYP domain-containing protein (c-di-GMP phosphodiesterase class II)